MMFVFPGCNNGNRQKTGEQQTAPAVVKDTNQEMKETIQNTSYIPSSISDSSKVQVVDSERFFEEVCEIAHGRYGFKSNVPIVIDFYADWCKPCCEIAPYLVEFAKKYAGKILIYKVNVDKCQEVAAAFGIESIPTLIFYKPNEQPFKQVGASSQSELEKTIIKLL